VASGGQWTDPETGEIQDKLHLHWRLTEPTRDAADHARLKEARTLACRLVGADATAAPINHPLRWPGSWHRKAEPRLCRIVSQTEHEIDLTEALELLQDAVGAAGGETGGSSFGDAFRGSGRGLRADHALDVAAALAVIPNADLDWDAWNRIGMATFAATEGAAAGAAAFHAWSAQSSKYDPAATAARWDHFRTSPPDRIGAGTLFHLAREALPGWRKPSEHAATEHGRQQAENLTGAADDHILDPWAEITAPPLPPDLVPRPLQRFVNETADVMGADPGGLLMAALACVSGALDHQTRLRMGLHREWREAPALWVALIGDPATKKSPIVSAAMRPLDRIQAAFFKEYQARMEAWEALEKGEKKATAKPTTLRFIANNTTIEALTEILAQQDCGILAVHDELAGWLASMERYAGGGKASSDRPWWLTAFQGGPYHVDRIGRGSSRVNNLSVAILGGIQPRRLRELGSLDTDGLLQRFIPYVLSPAMPSKDQATRDAADGYGALLQRLVGADPVTVRMTDPAAAAVVERVEQLGYTLAGTGEYGEGFPGFAGKLPAHWARLALAIHAISDGGEVLAPATAEHAERLLTDHLLQHAIAFYSGIDRGAIDKLREVAGYLLTKRPERVTAGLLARDVRCCKAGKDETRRAVERVTPIMEMLCSYGWAAPESTKPDNAAWTINQAALDKLDARGREEAARREAARRAILRGAA
jgi:hypothetical protein